MAKTVRLCCPVPEGWPGTQLECSHRCEYPLGPLGRAKQKVWGKPETGSCQVRAHLE